VPALDDRIARLLDGAAVEPTITTDVLAAIATKQRRRVTRRRALTVSAVACGLALVVGAVGLARTDDDPVAIAHQRGGDLAVRVVDGMPTSLAVPVGDPVSARRVTLDPDGGYVRGPVLASGEFVAVATYDRDGDTFRFPPSRVVRVDRNGRVLDEVDLQGEVRSLADGEGARWVLTRDAVVVGPADPEFRVKRIGPDGSVTSNPVPPGEQPNGDILAAGGGVWVPVTDGGLRFDPASGSYAGKIALPPAAHRQVAVLGKSVSATTGGGVARLDPTRMVAIGPDGATIADGEVVDAALGTERVWGLVQTGRGPALVAVDPSGALDPSLTVALPHDFVADRLLSVGGRLWVLGRAGDRATVVMLRELAAGRGAVVERVVVAGAGRDTAVGVTDHRTLVVADGGALFSLTVDD
jgi:hypothetical protein